MRQKKFFYNRTIDLKFIESNLIKLKKEIILMEDEILTALYKDLNKSNFEAYVTEIAIVLKEIDYTIKNLKKWHKPKKVRGDIINFPSKNYIYKDPYGICLIISPWNYPFQLSLSPLIGAIAGGNCCIINPSSYSMNTSKVIEKLIKSIFEEEYIAVIHGGRKEKNYLINQKLDYIFFTGSPNVGRVVMNAASKNLTPITLELGGKSPCIIDDSADINMSARKIIWGKTLNSGQTCIAPDFVLAHESVYDDLIEKLIYYIKDFFGDSPIENKDFPKIINDKHFYRLIDLIDENTIFYGGKSSEKLLKIEPTIIKNPSINSNIMEEEIFGPILPIIKFSRIDEVIELINDRPKPLALYLFTKNKSLEEKILRNISFGGGCINETILHISNKRLPFGGVGESGMGSYHGKKSFETFTHEKSILKKSNIFDPSFKYPPYPSIKKLKKLLKFF